MNYSKEQEENIWLTSDTHFGHNKDFVWKARGFDSVEEMNEAIVKRWNNVISPEDEVYHLGDFMLNNNENGLELLRQLNGHIHLIIGNHDTETRLKLFEQEPKIVDIQYATIIKCGKQYYFLSHYPTITANYDDKPYHQHLINLFGHTHQLNHFYNDNPFMFNVGMDSNDCYPMNLKTISTQIHEKVNELYQEKQKSGSVAAAISEFAEAYENAMYYFETHPLGQGILD